MTLINHAIAGEDEPLGVLIGNVFRLKKSARAGKTVTLEGWPSGLRRTLGKRVYGKTVPWVRIPLLPPAANAPFSGSGASFIGTVPPSAFGDDLWPLPMTSPSRSAR